MSNMWLIDIDIKHLIIKSSCLKYIRWSLIHNLPSNWTHLKLCFNDISISRTSEDFRIEQQNNSSKFLSSVPSTKKLLLLNSLFFFHHPNLPGVQCSKGWDSDTNRESFQLQGTHKSFIINIFIKGFLSVSCRKGKEEFCS